MAARVRWLLVLSGVAATLLAGVIAEPAAHAQSATCTNPTGTLTVSPTTVSPIATSPRRSPREMRAAPRRIGVLSNTAPGW